VRGTQRFRDVREIPIEEKWSVYDPDVKDAYFQTPEQLLRHFPTCLIANLNGTSHQQ
jgi:hypothetical protein